LINLDDRNSFELFFKKYYTRLIKFALLYVPIQEQAEDIVSDVLIKLLKKQSKFYQSEHFEGYLFMAVKNQSISYLRKQKIQYTHKTIEIASDHLFNENDPETLLEYDELTILVTKTINNLPPRRQIIFKLVKEENQKIKEVALLLDLSPKTVENHLSLAIKQLRNAIKAYLNEESI